MSTEYRRGIPSTAHVEAATRLGLLWEDAYPDRQQGRWRLEIRSGVLFSDFSEADGGFTNWDQDLSQDRYSLEGYSLRPIRPDGTPVDWEVLDEEVRVYTGRAGEATVTPTASAAPTTQPQGFRADLWRRIAPFYAGTGRTSLAGLEAPAGFGDQEIAARWTVYQELKPLYDLVDGAQGEAAMPRDVVTEWARQARDGENIRPDWALVRTPKGLLGRTTNQQGGIISWSDSENWLGQPLRNFAAVLDAVAERRVAERMRGQTQAPTVTSAQPEPVLDETALRSLILNLPNVAAITNRIERGSRQRDRYIVRVRLADPNVPLDRALAAQIPRNVHVHCNGHGAGGMRGVGGTAATIYSPTGNREGAVAPPIRAPQRVNVEPRRFADVRPDRHGWRWWRQTGRDSTDLGQRFETQDGRCRWRSAHADAWFVPDTANPQMLRYTVIPTDEQGNPVSWESIGPTDPTEMRYRQALTPGVPSVPAGTAQTVTVQASPGRVYDVEWVPTNTTTGTLRDVHTARIRRLDQFVAEAIQPGNTGGFSIESPPRPGQFSNNPAAPPLTPEGLLSAMQNYTIPGIHATVGTGTKPAQTEAITTWPLPLPRFTTDELDDVDHSKTTKLDEVTLRRGKLPTVEQIAKYREVRARRTGGAVADALKESRIDCEVAQYVLERWVGGLDNTAAHKLIAWVVETTDVGLGLFVCSAEARVQQWIDHHSPTLDTSEKPSPTVQRERQEAEERRQRLAELRQRLAAERAAQPQEMAKESEASRFALIEPDPQADPAASIRAWEARQAAVKVRPVAIPAKPAAALRRPAIEVVDAEADGLSRVEIVTALFGRALNGGC